MYWTDSHLFWNINFLDDWPEVVVRWAPFERQKIEVEVFERGKLSPPKFTTKDDLNTPKEVLLNLRFWPAQKPNIWSFSYGKMFI